MGFFSCKKTEPVKEERRIDFWNCDIISVGSYKNAPTAKLKLINPDNGSSKEMEVVYDVNKSVWYYMSDFTQVRSEGRMSCGFLPSMTFIPYYYKTLQCLLNRISIEGLDEVIKHYSK